MSGKLMRTGKTAPEICAVAELATDATGLLEENAEPEAYVRLLIEQDHYPDAIRFLAHALPKREAVWWAWFCARKAAGDEPPPEIAASLDATKVWITEPNDANRRAAMDRAQEADLGTPAGCAGLAAFFCGESLAPPDLDPVPPDEYAAAKAITGSIMMAAVSQEPEKAMERFQAYVEQGMEVARKTKLWEPPDKGR